MAVTRFHKVEGEWRYWLCPECGHENKLVTQYEPARGIMLRCHKCMVSHLVDPLKADATRLRECAKVA